MWTRVWRCLWLVVTLMLYRAGGVVLGGVEVGEYLKDRVVGLPGQPKVSFEQYAGYVTVNTNDGRALFYWLMEATHTASSKPLVLWLNGGPGCSSVAYGASEEIGPFRINKTATSLYINPYSWNKLANLIFLESPAGVGFSYTNTSSNLKDTGDERTAEDSLIFLVKWFARFPQYKYREMYITGESYAGHYIPQLAKKIYEYNKRLSKPFINLKGFMVGNAVTDDYYDNLGTVNYWWSHAMISDQTYHSILRNCNFRLEDTSPTCDSFISYAMNQEFGNIDQYSIYTAPCGKSSGDGKKSSTRFKKSLLTLRGYDPCTESYAEKYYNRADVQKALHANITGISYSWTACSDILIRNWQDSDFSILPIYKELIEASGLRIWMYSGDADSVVPVTATRFSLKRLNLTVKSHWYPWYYSKQVGGWTEEYQGLTFATIRGAGHEVPLFRPKAALQLFKSFLSGQNLPANPTV
ncbi:hypothetical protein SUGI_0258910 [Cryptomeria japonica]|uniref:serine carboxypeptidase 24 isoform X2 n=1 Tax=Cryptomeria japonica TaxID=3369 RepID=UPI0024089D09|nr:serine carboxypeptidase 24 isoform X2 [Cryptomeria japonica]GLJ15733.1 hypothetical protein SUGI_0258910 [Cryptomeria japonica]